MCHDWPRGRSLDMSGVMYYTVAGCLLVLWSLIECNAEIWFTYFSFKNNGCFSLALLLPIVSLILTIAHCSVCIIFHSFDEKLVYNTKSSICKDY